MQDPAGWLLTSIPKRSVKETEYLMGTKNRTLNRLMTGSWRGVSTTTWELRVLPKEDRRFPQKTRNDELAATD